MSKLSTLLKDSQYHLLKSQLSYSGGTVMGFLDKLLGMFKMDKGEAEPEKPKEEPEKEEEKEEEKAE